MDHRRTFVVQLEHRTRVVVAPPELYTKADYNHILFFGGVGHNDGARPPLSNLSITPCAGPTLAMRPMAPSECFYCEQHNLFALRYRGCTLPLYGREAQTRDRNCAKAGKHRHCRRERSYHRYACLTIPTGNPKTGLWASISFSFATRMALTRGGGCSTH
jgi:hypothetical protein